MPRLFVTHDARPALEREFENLYAELGGVAARVAKLERKAPAVPPRAPLREPPAVIEELDSLLVMGA